jgi:geranylgeranyl reductase family protein
MMPGRGPDILVVGLGPAGSRAAAAAAAAGPSVLAVDRRRAAGHPVQCAEFVPAMIGPELGSLESAVRQHIRAMATFVEDRPPDIRDDFPGHMIDRAAFDRGLVEAARRAGADCRFGTRVERFARDGTARLSDGRTIRPRLIVGADGPRSAVGRAAGRVNAELVETRQITVPLTRPHEATDIFLSAAIPGGYGWLFPKGEVANLGVGVIPAAKDRLKPLLEDLHRRLAEAGRLGTEILGHTGGAIPVGGLLDPRARLGELPVLLAGDAAGLTNPVTGAGIGAAVISGGLAGRAAAEWLGGTAEALDDYAEEIAELFEGALGRAVARRRELLRCYERGSRPDPAALRRGWVAYPEYWATP